MHISGTFTGMMQTGFSTLDSASGQIFVLSIATNSAVKWAYNYVGNLPFDTKLSAATSPAGETRRPLPRAGSVGRALTHGYAARERPVEQARGVSGAMGKLTLQVAAGPGTRGA